MNIHELKYNIVFFVSPSVVPLFLKHHPKLVIPEWLAYFKELSGTECFYILIVDFKCVDNKVDNQNYQKEVDHMFSNGFLNQPGWFRNFVKIHNRLHHYIRLIKLIKKYMQHLIGSSDEQTTSLECKPQHTTSSIYFDIVNACLQLPLSKL
jgi:hypothetical protein